MASEKYKLYSSIIEEDTNTTSKIISNISKACKNKFIIAFVVFILIFILLTIIQPSFIMIETPSPIPDQPPTKRRNDAAIFVIAAIASLLVFLIPYLLSKIGSTSSSHEELLDLPSSSSSSS